MNRFKGLDLVDRVPKELWTKVCNIIQEAVIKTIPKKRKCKLAYLGVKCHSVHSLVFKWYSQKFFPRGSVVKKLPANSRHTQEIGIQSLGWEDPLKEEMANHSSIPTWKIPWTGPWGCKESDTTEHACPY